MAVTKMITGETVVDGSGEDITELEDENDNDLSAIFAAFGGAPDDKTYLIKVYRVKPDTAEMPWLFNCVPSELPIDTRLRDQYKGGRFQIRIYENRGGKMILKKRPTMLVEAPQKAETATQSDLAAILAANAASQKQMFDQLQTVIMSANGRNVAPADPMGNMKDMLAVLIQMKELTAQPAAQGNSLRDTIETLGALKELMPEPRGGGETNFMDLLGKLIESPIVGVALQQIGKPAAQPMKVVNPSAPPQVNPQSPSVGVNPPPEQPELSEAQKMNMQLVIERIKKLCHKASINGDPMTAAVDLEEDFGIEFLKSMLDPAALDKAAMVVPDVKNFVPWFTELQGAIGELIKEAENPTAD